jgi:hypothetical protein
VELPEDPKVTLVGLRVHVSPDGETDDVSETVPVNPLLAVTVIVDIPAVPASTVTVVGLAVTVNVAVATV